MKLPLICMDSSVFGKSTLTVLQARRQSPLLTLVRTVPKTLAVSGLVQMSFCPVPEFISYLFEKGKWSFSQHGVLLSGNYTVLQQRSGGENDRRGKDLTLPKRMKVVTVDSTGDYMRQGRPGRATSQEVTLRPSAGWQTLFAPRSGMDLGRLSTPLQVRLVPPSRPSRSTFQYKPLRFPRSPPLPLRSFAAAQGPIQSKTSHC